MAVIRRMHSSPTQTLASLVCNILASNTATNKPNIIKPITHAIPIDNSGAIHYGDAIPTSITSVVQSGSDYVATLQDGSNTVSASYTITRLALANCSGLPCDSTNSTIYFDSTLATPVSVSAGQTIQLAGASSSINSLMSFNSVVGFGSPTIAGRGLEQVVLTWLKDQEATYPQVKIDRVTLGDSTNTYPNVDLSGLSTACDTATLKVIVSGTVTPSTNTSYDLIYTYINNTIEIFSATYTALALNPGQTYTVELRFGITNYI